MERIIFHTEPDSIEFVRHKSGAWLGCGVAFHAQPGESDVSACLRAAHSEHYDIHPATPCEIHRPSGQVWRTVAGRRRAI